MIPIRKGFDDAPRGQGQISTRARLREELESGLEYRFQVWPGGYNGPGYSGSLRIRNRHDFPIVIRACRFDTPCEGSNGEGVIELGLPFTLEAGHEIEFAGFYVNLPGGVVPGPAWKPLMTFDLDYAADLGSFSFSGKAEFGTGRRKPA